MNPQGIIDNLFKLGTELSALNVNLGLAADKKAISEREYRKALAIEIVRLKSDGMSVTLIQDIAKGNISEVKFERDKWETMYDVIRSQIRGTSERISIGQSVLNWLKVEMKGTGQ